MARPIKSFAERIAIREKAAALKKVCRMERVLAAIWLEIRGTRGRISVVEQAQMFEAVGFSRKEAAAMLGTSPQTISVLKRRREQHESDDAVGQSSDHTDGQRA